MWEGEIDIWGYLRKRGWIPAEEVDLRGQGRALCAAAALETGLVGKVESGSNVSGALCLTHCFQAASGGGEPPWDVCSARTGAERRRGRGTRQRRGGGNGTQIIKKR